MPTAERSDAFVFFGMSGDLARKKIFPALYSMVKNGILDVPVIGVASSQWTVSDLRKRAADSIDAYGGGIDDPVAFDKLTSLLRYIDGDYNDPTTYTNLAAALGGTHCPVHYLAIPPSMFPTVIEGARERGVFEERSRDPREAVRPRPRIGEVAERDAPRGVPRVADLPHRPLPGQGRDPEHRVLPLRQLVPRAHLEPQLRAPGPDHDGRGVRRRGSWSLLRRGRCPTRCRAEPPVPDPRAARDGAAGRAARRGAARLQGRRVQVDARARACRPRAWPVRRVPRRARRRARLRRRDVRGGADLDRLVAVGRRSLLHPRRQEAAEHLH